MTFNEGGQFEGGRVQRGGGGRGVAVAGGGIGALLLTVLAIFLGGGNVDINQILGGADPGSGAEQADGGTVGDCTAEQARTDPQCELSATAQSLDAIWAELLPEQAGVEYVLPEVVSFDGSVNTGCGSATAASGPFYCPPDQTVYIDVTFYQDLRERFGSTAGPLARQYVIAHEFGHHIQQLTGVMDRVDRGGSGPESDSVRVELMADCFAGMWAHRASTTPDPDTGVVFLEPISDEQLRDALSAAAAVGDDHIQESMTGDVNPEGFTHGTSEQRMRWFRVGYDGGTMQDCNTLDAAQL